MTKELRKEIYTKSKLKIKYKRSPTEENKVICKKRNKYIYIYIKKTLSCISAMWWKLVSNLLKTFGTQRFLTFKAFLGSAEIMLAEKGKIVTEEKELVSIYNDHYINIVESSCGN